jgi:hypothetical protein
MTNMYFRMLIKFYNTTGECERVNAVELNCEEGRKDCRKEKLNAREYLLDK